MRSRARRILVIGTLISALVRLAQSRIAKPERSVLRELRIVIQEQADANAPTDLNDSPRVRHRREWKDRAQTLHLIQKSVRQRTSQSTLKKMNANVSVSLAGGKPDD